MKISDKTITVILSILVLSVGIGLGSLACADEKPWVKYQRLQQEQREEILRAYSEYNREMDRIQHQQENYELNSKLDKINDKLNVE